MKEQLLFDITNLVTVVFEAFVVHMFLSDFLGQREEYTKAIKYARLGFMICLGISNLVTLNPIVTMPLIFILIFSSSFLYEGNIKTRLFATVLLSSFFILSEVVVTSIFVLFIKEDFKIMFENNSIRVLAVILSKIVFLFICKIVCLFKKDIHSDMPIKYWLPLLVIPLFSVFLSISIFDINKFFPAQSLKILNLISSVGILYINFIVFYLFKSIIEKTKLSMKYEMLEKEVVHKEELRLSNERYKTIVEQTDSVVFEWNIKEKKSFVSQIWTEKFGYSSVCENIFKEIRDKDLVHHEDYNIFESFFESIQKNNKHNQAVYRLRKSSGEYIWCRTSATNICNNENEILKVVGVIVDVDNDIKKYEELKTRAERDSLTNVYNKGVFEKLVEEAIVMNKGDKKDALFIIDLDDFKEINDNFGHPFGDFVLKTFAEKIQANFDNEDLIGRIGGDEFVVYMRDYYTEANIHKKAKKLNRVLTDNYKDLSFSFDASVSIGIARYPQNGNSFLELFKNADRALYNVKASGKNSYCLFEEDIYIH
ncbi:MULTISPECIES: sensor domain-containing diguanylate cyclase [unclassified Clostridioides]|uniref:sensor domain-containing diguanylate cyclase n=1 Tax=unclassified Clostridioides TaxID=2635829 RepID=UPI001D127BB3|nr:diguanylate cyclase [Clostridioides sp. ZZV14-6150]MCC0724260.1 diguanylate cyclase [Clostridioides sp. ZZV14-6104]MCC0728007.1 diguanylate cyclase [Clostridioides sp. ZZV14-6045]MCC0732497.1 diguanylate cyclase [Clostridioides sp. ZZV14-6048]MCC0736289.1 diguanylate cyclase [Clostridioides sp. ZZV14-6009]MCC0744548.1 diguanylate cyclase [Clostridioides sp. ZZV14-6044]MCC0752222.1 diguanylate cyclase [Clostridioides sp. ZZV13-5731]WLD27236.1 Diguanylate cyclase, GGDEF domain [Clostridioid